MLNVFTIKKMQRRILFQKFNFYTNYYYIILDTLDRIGVFPLDFFLKPDVLNCIAYKATVN